MPGVTEARGQSQAVSRPPLDRCSQYITMLFATWTTLGLFLDVWSHGQSKAESFFNPWHALFFPGFLITAGYIVWPVVRSIRAGKPAYAGVPAAYDLGVVGVLLFLIGVTGDMVWHAVFGLEKGIEAVMSPPHIFMLVGLVLISSIPFRAAWTARDEGGDAPAFRAFFPVVLSLTLAMLIISLGAVYFWGFTSSRLMSVLASERMVQDVAPSAKGLPMIHEAAQERGISNILITNLILLAPVFIMLRRWRLPFGSVTVLFTITGILMAAVSGTFFLPLLVAPVAGGALADWLIQRWRLSPRMTGELRAFALVVPLVMWSLYFAATQLLWGVGWSPGLWAGTLLWTAASGLGLSLVAVPGGRVP